MKTNLKTFLLCSVLSAGFAVGACNNGPTDADDGSGGNETDGSGGNETDGSGGNETDGSGGNDTDGSGGVGVGGSDGSGGTGALGGMGGMGGLGGMGGAGALFVEDCETMCEAADVLECADGLYGTCDASCPYLEVACSDEMEAYFACVAGQEHTAENTTCDPNGGLAILDSCGLQAAAIILCSSSL